MEQAVKWNYDNLAANWIGLHMVSIVDHLENWAEIQPNRCLSSFLDTGGQEKDSYTYSEFHERTRYLAEYLKGTTGLRQGDRALLIYPPGLEIIASFVACVRIGVIPVPVCAPSQMNVRSGLDKLRSVIRDCKPVVALTTVEFEASYRQSLGRGRPHNPTEVDKLSWVGTDNARGQASSSFRNEPSSILFLQYTSGSTSDPKGVIVSHDNVIHNAQSTIDHKPTGVSWLPQYHDMGLIGYFLHPMIMGGTTYGMSTVAFLKRPLLWLETMTKVQATYASSPNFGFEYCLREDKIPSNQLDGICLSSLRVLMNASEPVRADTYLRFQKKFARCGLRAEAHVVAYGLAENTLAVSHRGRRMVVANKQLLQHQTANHHRVKSRNSGEQHLVSCGIPIDGVLVRIVDPDTCIRVGENQLGEIWVAGKSTCEGYWNRPLSSEKIFGNKIRGEEVGQNIYLRTGDLGFLNNGELFVCGRIKDVLIIRGVNYYPHDIEEIVESLSPEFRPGSVAVFCGDDQQQDSIVVMIEVRDLSLCPDHNRISNAIRANYTILSWVLIFVPPRTLVRTTSGKLNRSRTRQHWLEGKMRVFASYTIGIEETPLGLPSERIRAILEPYNIEGREKDTLFEIGFDSLTLATIIVEVERLLEERDSSHLIADLELPLLQYLTLGEFLSIFKGVSDERIAFLRRTLMQLSRERGDRDRLSMRSDAKLEQLGITAAIANNEPVTDVLLTGPTGFFGPFLLASLLRRTSYTYHVLTRQTADSCGIDRIRASLRRARVWTSRLDEALDRRVRVVCGDIAQPQLGLPTEQWDTLAAGVQAVFHNAAMVNYIQGYEVMRPHNVDGTRELLRFACTRRLKDFHYVSSTIVFGWTPKGILSESDNNEEMANLDFGYAQTKWVAEQLVLAAGKQGLKVQIYRPSFITASTAGVGSRADITVRLLAFMINHGIAPRALNQISFLPADLCADNMAMIFAKQRINRPVMHVTVDQYYNMMDIAKVISQNYGVRFTYHDLPHFIEEMKCRCTSLDDIYPLVDFFTRSYPKIMAMSKKRYNNDQYREARDECIVGRYDSDLEDTVSYIMNYMVKIGVISCTE